MKHFPFKVINKGGKPYIEVQYRGETKQFVSTVLVRAISDIFADFSLRTVP